MRNTVIIFLFFSLTSFIFYGQKPELKLQIGHTNDITSVCFSPDGQFALSGSDDQTLKLWDIKSGREIRSFEGHSDIVTSVCFSPDGLYALSGSFDKTLKLWDIKSGREIRSFEGHLSYVDCVCFSPKGQLALSGSLDATIKLWDIHNGKEIRSFNGHSDQVNAICFSHDGRYALSGSFDNTMKLWDIQSGEEIHSFVGHSLGVKSVCFSPDDRYALSGSWDCTMKLWEIKSGKEIRQFKGHIDGINSICFSPDGKLALSMSRDNIIKLWNVQNGKEIRSFEGHTGRGSVCFSPDGKLVLSGSAENSLKLWDIKNGKEFFPFKLGHSSAINSVCFSFDGKFVLSGSNDNNIKLWDIQYGKEICVLKGHSSIANASLYSFDGRYGIRSVGYSPDGKLAISCAWDKIVKLWDIQSGKEIRSFIGHLYEINSICFSPDGQLALSGSSDESIKLWDIQNGKEIRSFVGHSGGVNSVCFSPNCRYALSGSGQTLILWDIQSGKEIRSFEGHSGLVLSVCFSPDGRLALSGSWDKTLRLWEIETGEEICIFKGHSDYVNSVCFSPDGRYTLSGSADNTIKLWDVQSGKEIVSLISLEQNDFIVVTPDYYFYCSKNANAKLSWRIGLKLFEFDQFDIQYNRPDIVLERIGYAPKELIDSYRKAYYKRLKKMKFDESMFSPEFHTPEIEIINKDSFHLSAVSRNIDLIIKASDTEYNIDRINVWINDVPVYGMNGISLRGQNKDSVLMDIPVNLSQGENKIQVSCLNEKVVESLKENIEIRYEPSEPEKSNVYFIGIGVSDYKDPRLNLTYSVKDIRDLAAIFKEKNPDMSRPDTLFNSHVTRENVIKLKQKLLNTKIDDEVILAISGHGFLSDSLDFYYGTYDIDYRHPEIKGLSYDDIEWLLDSIPARKKLVLMDACHSGEVDKDIKVKSDSTQLAFNVKGISHKGVEILLDSLSIGLQNSFELMQELFTNLSKGNGAVVISAAGGLEYAYEGPDWKNGVFTYSVRKGLKDNEADLNHDETITVNELKDYLYKQVETLTNGRQKPTSRRENLENDWRVW